MSQEIEELIRAHQGVLIVQLTDPAVESCRRMEAVVTEATQWRDDVRVVRLDVSLHREWARSHRVHGSPCTLVFSAGELRLKARGRFGQAQLRERLTEAGLL